MINKVIYLAVPYSSKDKEVVKYRVHEFCKKSGKFQTEGYTVLSALYNQLLLDHNIELPNSWEYWESTSKTLVSLCTELYVLTLEGWEDSTGVSEEIAFAKSLNIPIYFVSAEQMK